MKPMVVTLAAALLTGSMAFATAASAQYAYAPRDGAFQGQVYAPADGAQGYGGGYRGGDPGGYGQGYGPDRDPRAYDDRYGAGGPGQTGYRQDYGPSGDRGYGGGYGGPEQTSLGWGYGRDDGARPQGGYGDERSYVYDRNRRDQTYGDGYRGDGGADQGGYGDDGGGYYREQGYGRAYGHYRSYGRDRAPYDARGYDEYSGFVAPPIYGAQVYGYGREDRRAYYSERRRCGCGW